MQLIFKTGRVSFIETSMKTGLSFFIIQLIIFIFLSIFLPGLAVTGVDNRVYTGTNQLYINEFMADNDNTIEDPDEPGRFEDWIEIYNPGDSTVVLSGMYLTDDPNDPTQWRVPADVTIPSGGYLLFWADNDEEQGNTHTNFRLAAGGEDICLFGADGMTCIDSVTFGVQLTDVSYGRYPDGTGEWGFMQATPETANSPHNAPPVIFGTTHTPGAPSESDPVWVTCSVSDDGSFVNVKLTYDRGNSPVHITMHDDGSHHDGNSGDGLFGGQVPAFVKDTVVEYYVTATDDLGAVSSDPMDAPVKTYFYISGYIPPMIYINEFMADNDSFIEDPDDPNIFEDWIEIYNPGDSTAVLSGMYLTDDPNDPTQWRVPANVTIPPRGYLLFWADNDEEQGNFHTNFRLAADGENICLFGADGMTCIDSVTFGAQLTDVSYGRYPDGTDEWNFMQATPGTANSPHNAPPVIFGTTHTPVSPSESDPVWVTCSVSDDDSLVNVILTYDIGTGPVHVTMHDDGSHHDGNSGDGLFGGKVPAFVKDTVVEYYVTATDDLGAESSDPTDAPVKTYFYISGYIPPMIYINEFMADNDNIIEDPDDPNNFEDWIEIYNADVTTINLSGMYLTDALNNSKQWRIPEGTTIPAGGYLLFWADNDEEQGSMHTNFNLNRSGEEVGLFDKDSKRNIAIDTVIFGEQSTDISYGREDDGGVDWVFFKSTTPGYTNDSIDFYMELDAGWNMISLPVWWHNLKLSELSLDAMVVYGFEEETGYIQVTEGDNLIVGKAYWILLNNSRSIMLTGKIINEYARPIYKDGWHMIGACTSSAKSLANNCSIDVIYEYVKEFGYKRLPASENLKTGKGYWILLSNTIGQAELMVKITGSQ